MRQINAAQIVDESKFNAFHLKILLWCGFVLLCDGYDLVVYGSVIPSLTESWSLTSSTAGFIGSVALIGALVGALTCGILADIFGRKKVIISCFVLFNFMTLLTGFSQGPIEFAVYRFLGGIGLGGIMPIVVSLASEYSPRSLRSMLVGVMSSGFAVGGIAVSLLGIPVIPNLGWEWMFYLGALPLLAVPFLIKSLPESVSFHVAKGDYEKVKPVLEKLNRNYVSKQDDIFEVDLPKAGMPVTKIFTEKRGLSTLMFWIVTFMALVMVYGLGTWLPQLMVSAGFPLQSSLAFLFALNFGAMVGQIGGGWLADRMGSKKILFVMFILGAICLSLIGFKPLAVTLYLLVAIAGACSTGAQCVNNAYATKFYPTHIRTTGVGWALGMGRFGAIFGPAFGGILLDLSLPVPMNFIAFAIPGVIAAIGITIIQDKYSDFNINNHNTESGQKLVETAK
ncbi:MFS transporter, AAHS family, benzoate transport protein [Alteribacillus persepolensis]|uniref:MFS transporter, AAHS family, benzoate transport protein n=1 Tax=Alteribacillus persepolensis TaxID=568899 RepID=A0A1G8HS41_9BACI|nr:aromatic acid/H+ symport family MFS transporter [Alteribacillus persepolensis]SDI09449.1 MFS transporter, AAHS family, benzoate transport protein [Alteribacillus persepolensis]